MFFSLIIVFIGVGIIEVPDLIKKKHWRELMAFSFFLLVAFIMTLLQTLGVKLPIPFNAINYLIRDVLHLNYG
jgi:hypothetical protein